jgi:uncharacterized protein
MWMKLKSEDGSWNPYVAGALTGLLVIGAAYFSAQLTGTTGYLGASTTYARASGFILRLMAPTYVACNEYYNELKLHIDWEFMVVVGIMAGAFISSLSDRSFRKESMPPAWENLFGPSVVKRAVIAFLGGIVCSFGARLADGCPSGNGLSGMIQLSASGYAFFAAFFVTALVVAHFFYGRRSS